MYSTYNEEKSVVAERFIRSFKKNKIFKHMIAVLKKNLFYFNVLDDIVDNTFHRTIKMNPIDVKSDSYAEYNVDSNEKDPKFKVGNCVRVSKCKNIFAKEYTPNWSEEVFVIKKVKSTVPQTYAISDLNCQENVRTFHEKELQKSDQKEFRIEKVIKRKGNKLYVK